MKCPGKHLGPTDPLLPLSFKTTCLHCGIQVGRPIPPQPAADDERTAVEVRAAEIAVAEDDDECMSASEVYGFCCGDGLMRHIALGKRKPNQSQYAAGYLAAVITDHDATHDTDGGGE